ncbi:hypothetical protein Nepgr_019784 [Nepenthes gracilis]|uniref:Uncharacterized protein n=1 Tax=Nepenthes gracilis TaxID=150966 RepID=A0AAD3SU16_NEPGR|nr:hypothetical protein Nepgr_019784 [Nepenthes gracilis]
MGVVITKIGIEHYKVSQSSCLPALLVFVPCFSMAVVMDFGQHFCLKDDGQFCITVWFAEIDRLIWRLTMIWQGLAR